MSNTIVPCEKPKPPKPRVKHFVPETEMKSEKNLLLKNGTQKVSSHYFCDLYILGTIWIEAMKYVLIGSKFKIFPPIQAASIDPGAEVKKPPPMKYKDLPLFATPYQDYSEKLDEINKMKCPKADMKLLHEPLYPKVRETREFVQKSAANLKSGLTDISQEVKKHLEEAVGNTKSYLRDPDNKEFRQGVVAAGGIAGLILARKKPIYKKLFYTSLGTLAGGFLAFPKETDENFRAFLRESAKLVICFYNYFNDKDVKLPKESRPCLKDKPSVTQSLTRCVEKDGRQ